MTEPLPCPFCGNVGLTFADADNLAYKYGVAYCSSCGANLGECCKGEGWQEEATKEWNKRAAIGKGGSMSLKHAAQEQPAAPCARPEYTTVKLAGADYLDMLVDLDELRELLKEVALAYAQEIGLPFEECNNELFRRVKKALEGEA